MSEVTYSNSNSGGAMAEPEEMAADPAQCTPADHSAILTEINRVHIAGSTYSRMSYDTEFTSKFTADDLKYVSSAAILQSFYYEGLMNSASKDRMEYYNLLISEPVEQEGVDALTAARDAAVNEQGVDQYGFLPESFKSHEDFCYVWTSHVRAVAAALQCDHAINGTGAYHEHRVSYGPTSAEVHTISQEDLLNDGIDWATNDGFADPSGYHAAIVTFQAHSPNVINGTPIGAWARAMGPGSKFGPVYINLGTSNVFFTRFYNSEIIDNMPGTDLEWNAMPQGWTPSAVQGGNNVRLDDVQFFVFSKEAGFANTEPPEHMVGTYNTLASRYGGSAYDMYSTIQGNNRDWLRSDALFPFSPHGVIKGGYGFPAPSIAQRYAQKYYDLAFLRARLGKVNEVLKGFAQNLADNPEGYDALLDSLAEAGDDQDRIDQLEGKATLTAEEEAELRDLREAAIAQEDALSTAEARAATAELLALNTDEYASEFRAKEQCFLLKNLLPLAAAHIRKRVADGGQAYDTTAEGPAAYCVQGSPGQVVSALTYDPAYAAYYHLSPDKLSYLVPSVKFYQVLHQYYTTEGSGAKVTKDLGTPVDFETPFFQHITQQAIEDIMSGEYGGRGGTVGLKSFDWSYQGSNPATSRRDIKAKLVLHAQGFDDLLKRHKCTLSTAEGQSFSHEWTYVDLAIRRNRNHMQAPDVLYQTLKVVAGWSLPEADTENIGFTDDEIKAIKNSRTTMYLTIIDHAFDILEDGSVDFTIEYRAYIEGAFTSPEANILVSQEMLNRTHDRNQALAAMREDMSDPDGTCTEDDMAELRRRITNSIQLDKKDAHVSLIQGLENGPDGSRVYLYTVSVGEMMQFLQAPAMEGAGDWSAYVTNAPTPSSASTTAATTTTTTQMSETLRSAINFPEVIDFNESDSNPTSEQMLATVYTPIDTNLELRIPYFFLGDLIQVALENIDLADQMTATPPSYLSEEEQEEWVAPPRKFSNMRLLLGPVEIVDPMDPTNKMQINLADLPISVNYFMEWFLERIIAKNEVKWYIVDFVKDITRNLVLRTLGSADCFGEAFRQRSSFQNLYLVGGAPDPSDVNDPVGALISEAKRDSADGPTAQTGRLFLDEFLTEDQTNVPILSHDTEDEERSSSNMYHYVLLYAADPTPRDLQGDYADDLKKGVFHFHIGANKGIVKRIKFEKTDQPYLREARYFGQGYGGLSQLREPYKVTIDMFGNSKVFPGQTIFVDPSGLGYKLGKPNEEASDAHLLGLGGYHMIINVDHHIASGQFESTAQATWVFRGSPAGEINQTSPASNPVRASAACQAMPTTGVLATSSGHVPPAEPAETTEAPD